MRSEWSTSKDISKRDTDSLLIFVYIIDKRVWGLYNGIVQQVNGF